MFEKMYEIKHDQALNKFVVSPLGTEETEDYAIVCESEFDAKSLCTQITMQMVLSPSDAPINYKSSGLHPNGHTQLYVFSKRIS